MLRCKELYKDFLPWEKPEQQTRKRWYDNFLRVFDIANQLLACNPPFAPLCDVAEWMAVFAILNSRWFLK